MHFDDRLGTVLRLRASSGAVMRIQFRQLLDLLGTIPVDAHGEQIDAAFNRLGELSGKIPAQERAAMIADAGLRLRSPRLVAALTGGDPAIAAAALRAADLSADQWLDLIPALPPAARPHLRERRDLPPELGALLSRLGVNDRGLPPAATEVQTAAEPESVEVEREAEGAAPAATADE
ncbi:MAG TPA: sensor histidine kinase, partial [Novosphingobium sp.]|nr:sensor histidine kinase [Novosphingobium sp.]